MKRCEVLAPAASLQGLYAAVSGGADAIYLGFGDFNARRAAKGFTEEEFLQGVRFCRQNGVAVYLTLNILVFDKEECELLHIVELACRAPVDAFIVQDLGVAALLKEVAPSIPLHASTQLSIHSLDGVKILEEMGFSRVVLARELSLPEIRYIAENTSIELEVFVHGALCMSLSGQCSFSAFLGGRSGNRGLCAGPCRLPFRGEKNAYPLSLKDLCLADHVKDLCNAGVRSLKIEGRMKRPEYVYAAASTIKAAVLGEPFSIKRLAEIFSRSGLTDGYLTGKRDSSMFGYRTKEDVQNAMSAVPQVYSEFKSYQKQIPVRFHFAAKAEIPLSLTVSDGEHTATVLGTTPEPAENSPSDEALVRRQLTRLSDSGLMLSELSCEVEGGLFFSAAQLNALRRDAINELLSQRAFRPPAPFLPEKASPIKEAVVSTNGTFPLYGIFSSPDQIPDKPEHQPDHILLPASEILKQSSLVSQYGPRLTAMLPRVLFDTGDKLPSLLDALWSAGIREVLCDQLGTLLPAREKGFSILGGAGMNCLNSRSLEVLHILGISKQILSFELDIPSLSKMKKSVPVGYTVYGQLPLMLTRNCPNGGEGDCQNCKGYLTDRRGEKIPVRCSEEYSELFNPHPLYLGDKKNEIKSDFLVCYFPFERKKEVKSIIELLREGQPFPGKFTRGNALKKVL